MVLAMGNRNKSSMDYTSLGCCVLAFVLYLNTLNAGFVYDDRRAILGNTDVSGKTSWHQAFQNDYWGTPLSDSGSHGSYRPLCVLSFKFNYLMGGYTPWGYHLINNLMHCLATGLVVKLARHFLSSNCGVWITGTLFAAHPIHTEAVAGIVGRADLAACILYLLTYLTYLRHIMWRERNDSRQWLALGVTVLWAVCALLFKETAISALLVCGIFDVARGLCGFHDKHRFRTLGILAAVFATIFYIRLTTISNGPQHSFSTADNPIAKSSSAWTRFLTFIYLPIFNFKLLLYPDVLSFDWGMDSIPRIQSIWDIRNAFSFSFYTTILAVLWHCIRNLLATMGTKNLIKNSSKSLILMKQKNLMLSSASTSAAEVIASSSSSSSSSASSSPYYGNSNNHSNKKLKKNQHQMMSSSSSTTDEQQKSQQMMVLRQQQQQQPEQQHQKHHKSNTHYNQNAIEQHNNSNQQHQQQHSQHQHHYHHNQNQIQQRKSRIKRKYATTSTTSAASSPTLSLTTSDLKASTVANTINQNVNVLTSIQNSLRGVARATTSISATFLNNNSHNSNPVNNNNNCNRNKNIDFSICGTCKHDMRHTNLCRQINNNNNSSSSSNNNNHVIMPLIVNSYSNSVHQQHAAANSTTTSSSFYSNDNMMTSCRCHTSANYLEQKTNQQIVQNRYRKSCNCCVAHQNGSAFATTRSHANASSSLAKVAAVVRSKLDKHHDDLNNNNTNGSAACRLTPRSSRSSSSCSNSTTSSNTSNCSSCSSTISSCSSCTSYFSQSDSDLIGTTTVLLSRFSQLLQSYFKITPSHGLLLDSKISSQNLNSIVMIMSMTFLILPFLPASNLFFYVGFVVAERLLYLPSVGYCLLIGYGISKLMAYVDNCKKKILAVLCMVMFMSALSVRTWNRNYDWYDEESLYRSAIRVNPPKALGNLGSVLSSQGRYAEAEEVLLEALKHRPNMADVHFNLGILNQNQQNYKNAVENFQRAIKYRPNLAVAYLNLGTSLIALGRCREAASILKDGTKVDGTGVRDRMQHESARMSSYLQLGSLYAEQSKLQRALAVYREALHSFPFNYQHQVLLQRMGDIFGRLQQWDEAEKHHRAALDIQPDNVAAHLSYGLTLAKNSSRISEAELWFKRALKLAPHQSSVYHHYADFLVSTSRYEEAISYRLQAVELTPNDYALTVAVATTYRLLDNKLEAEKWYRKAVNLRPDDARAHTNLGAILHLLGRTQKAAASYKEALRLQPGDPTTLGNLAKLGIIEV